MQTCTIHFYTQIKVTVVLVWRTITKQWKVGVSRSHLSYTHESFLAEVNNC